MERELAAALAAAEAGAQLCLQVQRTLVDQGTALKQDRSPVTVADFGAQAVITYVLGEAFPDIPVVAEEHAGLLRSNAVLQRQVVEAVAAVVPQLDQGRILAAIDRGDYGGGSADRFWAVDPIDGTKGFLRREQYAVAIALIDGGEVVLGALACPSLPLTLSSPQVEVGCVVAAVRGGGAWLQPLGGGCRTPLAVSPESDPRRAVVCESVEAGHSSHSQSAAVAARLGVQRPPLRLDSQCKYALLARGEASVYLRLPTQEQYQEKIWDHAAGALLVEEAGGRVTDVAGRPLDFARGRTLAGNRGVVASNGYLHEPVLGAVGAVLRGSTPVSPA